MPGSGFCPRWSGRWGTGSGPAVFARRRMHPSVRQVRDESKLFYYGLQGADVLNSGRVREVFSWKWLVGDEAGCTRQYCSGISGVVHTARCALPEVEEIGEMLIWLFPLCQLRQKTLRGRKCKRSLQMVQPVRTTRVGEEWQASSQSHLPGSCHARDSHADRL